MPSVLSLNSIGKRLDQVSVIDNLSLKVGPGEFLVLVGPSGSGKSTLLRLVAGLIDPDHGEITLDEKRLDVLPPDARDISMVFQNYAIFPHLTAFENIAFGLRARKRPQSEVERRVKSVADTLGLSALLGRWPRQLSGGERQRIALARAMVREPKLFLMDEPLSNLDAQMRVQTRAEITALQARLRTTTVYVTHDQTEAMSMGSRVGVLHNGKLMQLDAPQAIYDRPRNLFVAQFLGSPPMNVIEVAVEDDAHVRWGAHRLKVASDFGTRLGAPKRQLYLGIRAEHVHFRAGGLAADAPTIEGIVEFVERTGPENLVTIAVGSDHLTARAPVDFHAARGDAVKLRIESSKAHMFDKESEESLLCSTDR